MRKADGTDIPDIQDIPKEDQEPPDREQDNWKNRSVGMRCGTCRVFVPKPTKAVQGQDHVIGRCRALPPTMKGWPVVFSDDWCGEHKLDEEKI
jgi:hypothetical protein